MPDCSKDKLIVITGCNVEQIVGTFCGDDNKPHDIYTHSKCATLKLVNGYKYASYFRVLAEFIDQASIPHSDCSWYERVLTEPSGVIISPGWPHGTGKNKVECNWRIKTQNDKSITLNIMDDDFQSNDYFPSCKSHLKLEGKQSNPYIFFYKYICDNGNHISRSSNTYNTYNYDVNVEYVFKKVFNNKNYRGLALGWTTYDNPKHHTRQTVAPRITSNHNKKNGLKAKSRIQFNSIGIVTSVVVFVVVISISCARVRHRRALIARQSTNRSTMSGQLNRERTVVAGPSSTCNAGSSNTTASGNSADNSNEIGKINNGLQISTTPYYLPPPKYTATDSNGPPPSYSDVLSSIPSSAEQQPPYVNHNVPYPAPPPMTSYPPPQEQTTSNSPPIYNGLQPITIPLQTISAATLPCPDTDSGVSGSLLAVAGYPQAPPQQQTRNDNSAT
ncbi:uncharacterized protein [Clytia hemisphaerica]